MTTRLEGIRCLSSHYDSHIVVGVPRRSNSGDSTAFRNCPVCGAVLRLHKIQLRHERWRYVADWWEGGQLHTATFPLDLITELGDLVRGNERAEPPPYLVAQVEEAI